MLQSLSTWQDFNEVRLAWDCSVNESSAGLSEHGVAAAAVTQPSAARNESARPDG